MIDIFTLIIEELVAPIPDLYYSLLDRHRRNFSDRAVGDIEAAQADALKTLKATCLTCRALVPFCQREIFAAVRFESRPIAEEKWRMVAKLDRLLQQSPHLSEYIRNVYFADDSRDHPKSNLISRVLLKLHNVRVFDVDRGCFSSGGNWRQFPDSIAVAIGTIVKLPSLRVLRMSYINHIPPEIVRATPQLLRLILCRCSWSMPPTTIEQHKIELSTHQPTNSTQTIGSADPLINQPTFSPKTLVIDVDSDEDIEFVLSFVKTAAELRHLQWFIQPDWTYAGLSKVLSTGISHTLTTLTVSVGPLYRSTEYPCFGLQVEIWRVPKQNVLRSLTFTFHYSLLVAFRNLEQFREIEKAITPDRFPCLTEICFHFVVLYSKPLRYDISEWLECYQANFPLLSSKKDIDFRCSLEGLMCNRFDFPI